MSWRRFLVLLGGLSADSRWMTLMAERAQKRAKSIQFASQADKQAYAASGYGMGSS